MNKKVTNILDKAENIVLVSMFVAMVLVIFFQVIMRYVFKNSLSWSEELGKFIFVWISWLGIAIGQKRGEHIRITLLVDRLPFKGQQFLNLLSDIIVILICLVTTYYSISLVGSQAGTRYAGIKISMSWGYLSVAVGCILMIIRCIASSLESIRLMREGKKVE